VYSGMQGAFPLTSFSTMAARIWTAAMKFMMAKQEVYGWRAMLGSEGEQITCCVIVYENRDHCLTKLPSMVRSSESRMAPYSEYTFQP
jgi:hypothetical protein